jgi:uncharacterized protein GlcG (DUF336 family)
MKCLGDLFLLVRERAAHIRLPLRGDGATIHTAESSFDKAYTVVTRSAVV